MTNSKSMNYHTDIWSSARKCGYKQRANDLAKTIVLELHDYNINKSTLPWWTVQILVGNRNYLNMSFF